MRLAPLFEDGAIVRGGGLPTVMRVRDAGEIDLGHGLVLADPWDLSEAAPRPVEGAARGRVEVAVACADAAMEVAAVRVALSEARTVAWRRADPPTTSTDSAHLVIADGAAAARLRRALAPFERRRAWVEALAAEASEAPGAWARRAEGGGAVVLVATGRDGAFPVWVGRDAERRPTAIVVDLGVVDARALARVGSRRGAPPRAYGPFFHAWLEAVGAHFDEPLVGGPPLDAAEIAALARDAGAAPPPEIAAYYARATPFRDGSTPATWHALAHTLPRRTRGAWWPLVVRDEVGGVVALADGADVLEVADVQGGSAYLVGADLRSFFVNQALTLFGEESLA